ncbi:MAG: NCS2 family permease [Lentisphaeria bacterium]|nr:NCS2 family permease [Lentisphaeria bacterium]
MKMCDAKRSEQGFSVRTEILAGLTTFLSMAYILALYPSVMSKIGLPPGGAMIAAALSAAFGTFLMGLLAKYPFALAPGVGIVPFFAFSVVTAMKISWQFAMMAVFVEGLLFIVLSLTKVREMLFDIIPRPLKTAISVGIGMFIIYIAFQGARVITAGPCLTALVQFRTDFRNSGLCALLALVGTGITAKLYHHKVIGALLWGILITWGMGMLCQWTRLYQVDPEAGMFSLYPTLSFNACGQAFEEFGSLVGQCLNVSKWSSQTSGLSGLELLWSINFMVVIFTLLFDDLFNTIGTLAGISSAAGMLDKDGRLPRAKDALLADAIATSAGALLGATTTTTYVESATGILAGGRTRLTAYSTAALFLASIVLAPVFTAVPTFAIAPALVVVGFCMIAQITQIDFTDLPEALPCLMAIIFMPFAYNIADGIFLGFIFWTVINLICGRKDRVNAVLIVLSVLFVLKYIFL